MNNAKGGEQVEKAELDRDGPPAGGGEVPRGSESWSLSELVYGALFRPVEAFRHIARTRPVKPALLVAFTVYVFQGLLLAASLPEDVAGLLPAQAGLATGELPVSLGLPAFVTFLTVLAVGWFLATAVFHLLAGFMGHAGSGPALFAGLGFATLPLAFGSAAEFILGRLAGLGGLATLATIASLGWNLVLVTIAIRETYRITSGRAVAILFLPLAVAAGVIVITAIALIIAVLPFANFFGAPSL